MRGKRLQTRLFALLLFVVALDAFHVTRAEDPCLESRESALRKVNEVFKAKTDSLSQAINGLPQDSADRGRLTNLMSDLAGRHSEAIKAIEDAAHECEAHASGPEKISQAADDFSRHEALQSPHGPIVDGGFGVGADTRPQSSPTSASVPREKPNVERNSASVTAAEAYRGLFKNESTGPAGHRQPDAGTIASVIRDPMHSIRGMSPSSSNPTLSSALDAALKNLVAGNVAFNNPERMTVGRSKVVEVKLSTTLSPEDLKAQLTEAGKKENATLEVGDRMAATLNGGDAFTITPGGPQLQWISRSHVTTWTWDVTPKLSGTQYLILQFDAVITIDGKDGARTINTLKHPIEVDVGWPDSPSEWFELAKKWADNIGWFWASILVPIGALALGWLRKRPSPESKADTPA